MKKQLLISTMALTAIALGCRKESPPPRQTTLQQVSNPKNPDSLANMRKALADLSFDGNLEKANSNIKATHYYLKFMPRTDAELELLKADTALVLYPFPIDTEDDPANGRNYRDPTIPIGQPTYQYAAVPISKALPNVPYVKLDDLFLPNESKPTATVKLLNGSSVSARALTDLSLTSVQGPKAALPKPKSRGKTMNTDGGSGLNDSNNGSFDNSATNENGNAKSSDPYRSGEDWRPHGRVFVNDDIKGEIGVEGIKVRARRWFTTYVGFSDANGYFAVDGWFTRPANYWLDFERYEFSVNDHSGGPKDVDGPKIESPWYHEFRGYEKFCSTIFRAAYHYYYKDIQGLRRPPENGFWKTQVKIGAFNYRNEDNDGNNSPIRATFGIGELIHIYNPQNRIDEIYATTIHELGHAVHLELTGGFWADTKVCESWARGVQWVLTKMEYPNYIGGTQNNIYTNIIMDMIDDESNNNYYGLRGTKDQVSGYNIIEIQNSLLGVMSWDAWKNKLKNDYENSTEQYLESLFANWANY